MHAFEKLRTFAVEAQNDRGQRIQRYVDAQTARGARRIFEDEEGEDVAILSVEDVS